MKKNYLTALVVLFSTLFAIGQVDNHHIDIDTITIFSNKVLVDFKSYSDTNLIENIQAYLYTDTTEYKKTRWLFWSRNIQVVKDSVVYHGTARIYGESGKYRIGKYNNGKKIEMKYFDSKGDIITKYEFYGRLRSQGDHELGYNIFFIHGKN